MWAANADLITTHDFDPLLYSPHLIAGERAVAMPQLRAQRGEQGAQALRGDCRIDLRQRALRVALGLVACRGRFYNAILDRRAGHVNCPFSIAS